MTPPSPPARGRVPGIGATSSPPAPQSRRSGPSPGDGPRPRRAETEAAVSSPEGKDGEGRARHSAKPTGRRVVPPTRRRGQIVPLPPCRGVRGTATPPPDKPLPRGRIKAGRVRRTRARPPDSVATRGRGGAPRGGGTLLTDAPPETRGLEMRSMREGHSRIR